VKGRPAKPYALRVLEGNRGHRALPNPPNPSTAVPTCPKVLQGEARKEWFRVGRELQHLGLLAKVDRGALTAYCIAWARLLEAEEHLTVGGAVVPGKRRNKENVRNPWLIVQRQAMDQVHKFGAEFGLTPSSRSRLGMLKKKDTRPLHQIAAERAAARRLETQCTTARRENSNTPV